MLTKEQIQFLDTVCPNRWTECNGIVNVKGNVNMFRMNLTRLPVQFGEVGGHFDCQDNKLTSLLGCPSTIIGYFNCDKNLLTNLEGGPLIVGGFYSCSRNQLSNLIAAPVKCNYDFFCSNNKLTSLIGCSIYIGQELYCYKNANLNLFGIGHVKVKVVYDNENRFNKWIIECMKKGIIFKSIEDIKFYIDVDRYMLLKTAPSEIRQLFSQYELYYVDNLC